MVKYIPGSRNHTPDILSRQKNVIMNSIDCDNSNISDISSNKVDFINNVICDPKVCKLAAMAVSDEIYKLILTAVKSKVEVKHLCESHPAHSYSTILNTMNC